MCTSFKQKRQIIHLGENFKMPFCAWVLWPRPLGNCKAHRASQQNFADLRDSHGNLLTDCRMAVKSIGIQVSPLIDLNNF